MTRTGMIATAVLLLAVGTAQAGERAAAMVECQPVEERLTYTCTIMVKGRTSGEPVAARDLTVKANMPSMAMAHNVPPAKATPVEGQPGTYEMMIELAMFGEWALAIDINGKTATSEERVREKVIVKHTFGEAPAGGTNDNTGHGAGHGHKKTTD